MVKKMFVKELEKLGLKKYVRSEMWKVNGYIIKEIKWDEKLEKVLEWYWYYVLDGEDVEYEEMEIVNRNEKLYLCLDVKGKYDDKERVEVKFMIYVEGEIEIKDWKW
jgi:hypothetical protein